MYKSGGTTFHPSLFSFRSSSPLSLALSVRHPFPRLAPWQSPLPTIVLLLSPPPPLPRSRKYSRKRTSGSLSAPIPLCSAFQQIVRLATILERVLTLVSAAVLSSPALVLGESLRTDGEETFLELSRVGWANDRALVDKGAVYLLTSVQPFLTRHPLTVLDCAVVGSLVIHSRSE